MKHYCLKLEYNGAGFHGWQTQPGVRTIQTELHRALEMVLKQEVHRLTASGRTDAGVHAKGQVVAFQVEKEVDEQKLLRSVSSVLKSELTVLSIAEVDSQFHATHHAVKKQYTYTILNRPGPAVLDAGYVWHISRPLDVRVLGTLAIELLGEHDFTSFRGARCNALSPVRRILESEVQRDGDYIKYRVVGEGFLKQMVRIIVGTLVGLEKGSLQCRSVAEVIARKERDAAGITAPPHGLCLDWVDYGYEIFRP